MIEQNTKPKTKIKHFFRVQIKSIPDEDAVDNDKFKQYPDHL